MEVAPPAEVRSRADEVKVEEATSAGAAESHMEEPQADYGGEEEEATRTPQVQEPQATLDEQPQAEPDEVPTEVVEEPPLQEEEGEIIEVPRLPEQEEPPEVFPPKFSNVFIGSDLVGQLPPEAVVDITEQPGEESRQRREQIVLDLQSRTDSFYRNPQNFEVDVDVTGRSCPIFREQLLDDMEQFKRVPNRVGIGWAAPESGWRAKVEYCWLYVLMADYCPDVNVRKVDQLFPKYGEYYQFLQEVFVNLYMTNYESWKYCTVKHWTEDLNRCTFTYDTDQNRLLFPDIRDWDDYIHNTDHRINFPRVMETYWLTYRDTDGLIGHQYI